MLKHSSRSRTKISSLQHIDDRLSSPSTNLPSMNNNISSFQNSKINSQRNSISQMYYKVPKKQSVDVYQLLQPKSNSSKYHIGDTTDYNTEKIIQDAEKKLNAIQFTENLKKSMKQQKKRVSLSDSSDVSIEYQEKKEKKDRKQNIFQISSARSIKGYNLKDGSRSLELNPQDLQNIIKDAQQDKNQKEYLNQSSVQSGQQLKPQQRQPRKSIFGSISQSMIVSPNFAQSHNLLENQQQSQSQLELIQNIRKKENELKNKLINQKTYKKPFYQDEDDREYLSEHKIMDRIDKRSQNFLKRNQSLTDMLQKSDYNQYRSEKNIYIPQNQQIKEEPEEEQQQQNKKYTRRNMMKSSSQQYNTNRSDSDTNSIDSKNNKGCMKDSNNRQGKIRKSVFFGNKSIIIDSKAGVEKYVKTKNDTDKQKLQLRKSLYKNSEYYQ